MNDVLIQAISKDDAAASLPDLISLLQNTVNGGASVGFMPPLSVSTAEQYWSSVFADVSAERRHLLVARADDRICGSVQLSLVMKENGLHRADVEKLIVHSDYRNRGIAHVLLQALEEKARDCKRTLLVLDTVQDSVADRLYRSCGYVPVGAIPNYALSA
ncbi:MAG TPA: GNAT family N-acetyltransferase [Pyrinomonadaceae bacterium]|nr:GNAT family N-acetyltransferase [Pyrinomonadaceae bacterium]